MAGKIDWDGDEPKIKWGGDMSPESVISGGHELLRSGDSLLVDPSLFRGQFQTDLDLCNYLVFAAQIHLCNLGSSGISRNIINSVGMKGVAELVRKQLGQPRLSSEVAVREFKSRNPNTETTSLPYFADDNETAGSAIVRMLEAGFLPSVVLGGVDGHAVLPIGFSADRQQLVVWDGLNGRGDPSLRRLDVSRDDLKVGLVAKINSGFDLRNTSN